MQHASQRGHRLKQGEGLVQFKHKETFSRYKGISPFQTQGNFFTLQRD